MGLLQNDRFHFIAALRRLFGCITLLKTSQYLQYCSVSRRMVRSKSRSKCSALILQQAHGWTLFEEITSFPALYHAWKRFARGKRSRSDVQVFGRRIEDDLWRLHRELTRGTWRHSGYCAFQVCDPKPRQIHKASVRDRVVHHAVVAAIAPMFERSFLFDSWSCRTGKGTSHAVDRAHALLERASRRGGRVLWVLQCDIARYFASIDHDLLLRLIARQLPDPRVFEVVREIVGSFSPGLPLGNFTSQLFANVYLDGVDHVIAEQMRPSAYLRYTDDFLLLHPSRDWLAARIPEMRRLLWDRRRLTLHPRKVRLRPYHWGIDWLGSVLMPGDRTLRPRSRRRMFRRIAGALGVVSDEQIVSATLASYRGMAGHTMRSTDIEHLINLDLSVHS